MGTGDMGFSTEESFGRLSTCAIVPETSLKYVH